MITEDYVSFEAAKLLKEKGFDINTLMVYSQNGNFMPDGAIEDTYQVFYAAPTLQMTMKWLRKVHNIHISINMGFDVDNIQYFFFVPDICIFSNKAGEYQTPFGEQEFNTYEETVEAGIKYCLENLI